LLEGMLDLVPSARVAHVGLYRDHDTLEAIEYYFKAPDDLEDRLVIVVDPMLATANSAIAAVEKLKARGATVDYVTCYRRAVPALDPAPLLKLWHDRRLDALTITSSEGLRNLYQMVGKLGQSWLKKTPTFVPHARIAEQARTLGLSQVILTGPADAGLLAGLLAHFSSP
jgi:uroporphyrinogen-III synthase